MRPVLHRLALAAMVSLAACSRLVDSNASQCAGDSDCIPFPGTICATALRVCVPTQDAARLLPAADTGYPADAEATCTGAGGCYLCVPAVDSDFFNACTNSTCIPFDNRTRLANLAADGSLLPLP